MSKKDNFKFPFEQFHAQLEQIGKLCTSPLIDTVAQQQALLRSFERPLFLSRKTRCEWRVMLYGHHAGSSCTFSQSQNTQGIQNASKFHWYCRKRQHKPNGVYHNICIDICIAEYYEFGSGDSSKNSMSISLFPVKTQVPSGSVTNEKSVNPFVETVFPLTVRVFFSKFNSSVLSLNVFTFFASSLY